MNNKSFANRADRRAAQQIEARRLRSDERRKRATKTVSYGVAGAFLISSFGGVSAAFAAPASMNQSAVKIAGNTEYNITTPTLDKLSLKDGVLTGSFLGDEDNKQPKYTMSLVAAEDHSAYEGLMEARDKTFEAYEYLTEMAPSVEADYEAWSTVEYTFDSDETNVKAHLSNGDVRDFDTLTEARAYTQSVLDNYREFLVEYSRATNEYNRAENALQNFKPTDSLTNYTLTIDGSESGFDGPITNGNGDIYGEGGFVQVDGAANGRFHIIENVDGIMVLDVSFGEETAITGTRVEVNVVAPAPEEVPTETAPIILDDRAEYINMPHYAGTEIDLVSGVYLEDGADFAKLEISNGIDFGSKVSGLYIDYTVKGDKVVAEAADDHDNVDTRTFEYRITDSNGVTYIGNVTVTAYPSGNAPGLEPVYYNGDDSRTAFKDVTNSFGIFRAAMNENGNSFDTSTRRLTGADGKYATQDNGFGVQGERIAVRPTANDIAGAWKSDYSGNNKYDPNTKRNVFDYSTLQIKDPVTGLWTSSSYEGKNGLISVLPAEGTGSRVLGANNEFAEAVVAFDPRDRSALVSEQTEYRIGIVSYGKTIEDVEDFWANASENDYVSSTVTFGITEHFRYDGSFASPYCAVPGTPSRDLSSLEHASFFEGKNFWQSGSSTGSSTFLECAPVGVADKATAAAGETTVVDVLLNDAHISTWVGFDGSVNEVDDKNYAWNADSLRLVDEDGNLVMSLKTENGYWEVANGKLLFTANKDIKGTKVEEVKYSATQVWVGNPEDTIYGEFYDYMTKPAGGTISDTAATVIINGTEEEVPPVVPEPEPTPEPEVPVIPEPEVPVVPEPEPTPEPEVPVVPEPEVPVIPEPEVPVVPEPEVPVIPEPEVPVIPEPEVPVVPEPEVPVIPEPEVPVTPEEPTPEVVVEVPKAPTPSDSAKGETPTVSGMEISEFLALYAAGSLGLGAMAYLGLRRLRGRDAVAE